MDDRAHIRAAHDKFQNSQSPLDALEYLIAARDLIAAQEPPEGYRQRVHFEGINSIIGDGTRPALLNASYGFFGTPLLSISFPMFVRQDVSPQTEHSWEFYPGPLGQETLRLISGFNNTTLGFAFNSVLQSLGVQFDTHRDTKYGYDTLSQTQYIERPVASQADFDRGHAIIESLVRGDVTTDPALRTRIKNAMAAQNSWRSAATLTTPLTWVIESSRNLAAQVRSALTFGKH